MQLAVHMDGPQVVSLVERVLFLKTLPWFADAPPDPLAVIAESIALGRDVGVESATGTGKTYEAAVLSLWFIACFADAIVITTAPK